MQKIVWFIIFITLIHAQKNILIDLTSQTLKAIENKQVVLTSSITSGRAGYATPSGNFKILNKEKMHISNRYPLVDKKAGIRGGAKMPYMLRVTNTGVAIHAGEMVDYPDSHGCIRLPYGKAMQLYKWTDIGTKISIAGSAPYDDKINKMRLGILKQKKYRHKKKSPLFFRSSPPVKWVDASLAYYDQL